MSRPQPQPCGARPQDLPVKADLARLRVEYVKDSRLAYLGHLDLIATIERCVRRAALPFSIGNGFARRMRVQFSGALPVGASSSCEYYDLRLDEPVGEAEALERLRAATPPALAPTRAAYVAGRLPALEAWLDRASWEVVCSGASFSAADLADALGRLRSRGELTYLRGEREKRVDLSATLVGLSVGEGADGVRLTLETRTAASAALRPSVLLTAALREAGLSEPASVSVRRTGQWHEEDGRLVEPFDALCQPGATPLS
ncbi:DUF2344 domain-containing protein [Olsenella uli]|uniref:TIGR03936 family radical SAM-associated protein n=1 Tax=Olsenella uli TaxID=133926 RepID=UPI0019574E0D|nr:DUF2344 domain-containing protein [Olsenella uli]